MQWLSCVLPRPLSLFGLSRCSVLSVCSLGCGAPALQSKPKHPKQEAARRVTELEADRRVLLAQLNLQAHTTKHTCMIMHVHVACACSSSRSSDWT